MTGGWAGGRMGGDAPSRVTRAGEEQMPLDLAVQPARVDTTEFVYAIGSRGSPTVKIGMTKNLRGRLADLQTGSSEEFEILWFTAGGRDLEQSLHEHLARFRTRGEWFTFASPEDALREVVSAAVDIVCGRPPTKVAAPRRVSRMVGSSIRVSPLAAFDETVLQQLPVGDSSRVGASAIAGALAVDRGRIERSLRRLEARGLANHSGEWAGWGRASCSG